LHATNHALIHSREEDYVGAAMMQFPTGVSYFPLIYTVRDVHGSGPWQPILHFPWADLVRNLKVRMHQVVDSRPFEVETDGLIVDVGQWFPLCNGKGDC
ncbi:MAG: hypothetical protein ACTSRN_04755, partial [Alphaproteobacteria bacterium]